MKYITLYIFSCLLLHGCSCVTKAEVLTERRDTTQKIINTHGQIIPPIINDVPDISECTKEKSV